MQRASLSITLVAAAAALVGCADPCEAPGALCTWGGTGKAAFNGDGQDRLQTALYWPVDVTVGTGGEVYLLDWNNHRVRRVDEEGVVQTVIGTASIGDGPDEGDEVTSPGVDGTTVNLNHPTSLVRMPDGTLLLAAWHNHKLRRWDPATGKLMRACGAGAGFAGDGTTAHSALLNQPKGLAVNTAGDVFIADQRNQRVRRIDAVTGIIETIAGNGTKGFSGDGGPATAAQLSFPTGSNPLPGGAVAVAPDKTLYIADTENHRVRRLDAATGTLSTVAGVGSPSFSGDGGPATEAGLQFPRDIALGEGVLYIADTENHRIRAVDLETGIISTVAGTGTAGFSGEGKDATRADLNRPMGVEVAPDGDLYISDTYNHRVRRLVKGATR